MKTRNELQKEVKALRKALEDLTTSTLKLDEMNDTLLAENKRLESEIERNDGAIVRQSLRLEELNNQLVKFWEIESQNKQLQAELEERNQVISNLEIDAAGYRLAVNDFRNDFKKLEKINIDAVSAKQLAEKDLRDIKSKSLFQLIRWWYNAKN